MLIRKFEPDTRINLIMKASAQAQQAKAPPSPEDPETVGQQVDTSKDSPEAESSRVVHPNLRQDYRNWRVTPPSFGKSTGLTIVYEGIGGGKIFVNSQALIKNSNTVLNRRELKGRATYSFQLFTPALILRSVNYQKAQNPTAALKITLRYYRVNFESEGGCLFQKVYDLKSSQTGDFTIDKCVEQFGINLSKEQFLDPLSHISTADDSYEVSESKVEQPFDV